MLFILSTISVKYGRMICLDLRARGDWILFTTKHAVSCLMIMISQSLERQLIH